MCESTVFNDVLSEGERTGAFSGLVSSYCGLDELGSEERERLTAS